MSSQLDTIVGSSLLFLVKLLYILIFFFSVTVSLVTIKGTDCRIMELGQVVNKTAGEVGTWNSRCNDP